MQDQGQSLGTRKKEDEDFAEKAVLSIYSGKEFMNDLAHAQLIRNIQNGDMGAIKFQLGNCHDDYLPKKSVQPFRFEDLQRDISISSIAKILELEEYRQLLKRDGDHEDLSDADH